MKDQPEAGAGAVPEALSDGAVRWQPWNADTFAAARAANRMIFVDVGIEGCARCRTMEERTLTHPAVVERLSNRFVSIQVDAEARPDLGERYSGSSWPAALFMAPDGSDLRILHGTHLPERFLKVLEELIGQQDSGELVSDRPAPGAGGGPRLSDLDSVRRQARMQLDEMLDESLGSWRSGGLSAGSWRRYEHLAVRAHQTGDTRLLQLVDRSAATHLELLDPVWGGAHESWQADDGSVAPGKRISAQAGALRVFADAYQRTGEARYQRALERVDSYLQEWMRSERGTYYTSQLEAPPRLPARLTAADYWRLKSEHQRRQFGIPSIDHAIYTDKNAQVISGYARAFEATTEPYYLAAARAAADALLVERLQPGGWIRQSGASRRLADDTRQRPAEAPAGPYLAAQVWMAAALLDLYQADPQPRWLEAARTLADALVDVLSDDPSGGFYSAPPGNPVAEIQWKSLEMNALAANVMYRLGVHADDASYDLLPGQILRAVALPDVLARWGGMVAETGLALEWLSAGHVEVFVVSKPDDPLGQILYRAALGAYHPRKILRREAPGRFPAADRAALYICNPDRCTPPIDDPAAISIALAGFPRGADTPYP